MPKFRLTIHKIIDVDTDKWGDNGEAIRQALEATNGSPEMPTEEELHDALRFMLEEDMGQVFDTSTVTSNDIQIEITGA